jgi:hypothetical protein
MENLENLMDIFFTRVEIPIINCPPGLDGAEVEYQDENLLALGIVENGKLVMETGEVIPEDAVIVWGKGRWVINW